MIFLEETVKTSLEERTKPINPELVEPLYQQFLRHTLQGLGDGYVIDHRTGELYFGNEIVKEVER